MSAAPKLSGIGTIAERLAAEGFRVFPCHTPTRQGCSCGLLDCPNSGKHPRTANGFHAATNSVAQVREWWSRWPEANIGCVPGPRHLVIDIDGPDGELTAQQLGLLSEPTLEVSSGRVDGGRHRWYHHPGGTIGNAALGHGVDVRADAGYVILPPSVHSSGRVYRWLGKVTEIVALPPHVIARLRAAPADRSPASAIPLEPIRAGERNQSLTRYAGRMFANAFPAPEVLAVLVGLNETRCDPPLKFAELERIVQSIWRREAAKRTTSTGVPLVMVHEEPETDTRVDFSAVAATQTDEANTMLDTNTDTAARWSWPALDRLSGMLLPGEVHVIGALSGNGKTAFLMSQMDAFRQRGVPVLYVPLETDPHICRVRWAAWGAGLDPVHVLRREWGQLPTGAKDAIRAALAELGTQDLVHFVPERRIDMPRLRRWMEQASGEYGCEVVMIDHVHRMAIGNADTVRVDLSETVRTLQDWARALNLVVILAAQLNRNAHDLFDRYSAPSVDRLKETGAINEEAWTVHMLSRVMRRDVTAEDMADAKRNRIDLATLADPGVMRVTNRKDRIAGAALDRSVLLHVQRGRVVELDRYRSEDESRDPPSWVTE